MINKQDLFPYIGIDDIKLYSNINEVKEYLKNNEIEYKIFSWSEESETVSNPWTIIEIKDTLKIVFANNDKCFEIIALKKYLGKLPNGICVGMKIDDAMKIDKTIQFEDFEEYYYSDSGYWLDDDLSTGNIVSITIFIKEIEDDDFDDCKW